MGSSEQAGCKIPAFSYMGFSLAGNIFLIFSDGALQKGSSKMWSYKAPDELHHPTSSNPVLFHDAVIAIERLKHLKIQIFPEPSFFLS